VLGVTLAEKIEISKLEMNTNNPHTNTDSARRSVFFFRFFVLPPLFIKYLFFYLRKNLFASFNAER